MTGELEQMMLASGWTKRAEGPKASEQEAGYLELTGAIKNAGCSKVNVAGGVSAELGCCNLFRLNEAATKKFSCGTCKFVLNAKQNEGTIQKLIADEQEAQAAYADAIKRSTDEHTTKVLEHIMEEESEHEQMLDKLL